MKTSYYANLKNLKKGDEPIAISRGVPEFFNGKSYPSLAPPWDLVKEKDKKIFADRYKKEVLEKLNPEKIFQDLGENAVLLCWEKDEKHCHRRLVALWLEENLKAEKPNLQIPEAEKF